MRCRDNNTTPVGKGKEVQKSRVEGKRKIQRYDIRVRKRVLLPQKARIGKNLKRR